MAADPPDFAAQAQKTAERHFGGGFSRARTDALAADIAAALRAVHVAALREAAGIARQLFKDDHSTIEECRGIDMVKNEITAAADAAEKAG